MATMLLRLDVTLADATAGCTHFELDRQIVGEATAGQVACGTCGPVMSPV
jgi:hypothetical protein